MNDTFAHNNRSELTAATVNGNNYEYAYDNIGNRQQATEGNDVTVYDANALNQYTAIGDFEPTYDDAGNQTTVKTTTGIWSVIYNAENRPTSFTNTDSDTIVECTYDYMGRRATKKVTVNGIVTLQQRFLYRGYLQIACCDLTRSNHPCLWLVTWDPSQPVTTRPLAIQKNGTWYAYGWDVTKNICEIFGSNGYIRASYTYSPYGEVTESGDVEQSFTWSSEYNDAELGLVYYNYRHYNPHIGRWISRDMLDDTYLYLNNCIYKNDWIGLVDFSVKVGASYGTPFFVKGDFSVSGKDDGQGCYNVTVEANASVGIGASFGIDFKKKIKTDNKIVQFLLDIIPDIAMKISVDLLSLHTQRKAEIKVCECGVSFRQDLFDISISHGASQSAIVGFVGASFNMDFRAGIGVEMAADSKGFVISYNAFARSLIEVNAYYNPVVTLPIFGEVRLEEKKNFYQKFEKQHPDPNTRNPKDYELFRYNFE